jgi:hypothetical protein
MIVRIIKGLLLISGAIFLILSVITLIGIVLIQMNGGVV